MSLHRSFTEHAYNIGITTTRPPEGIAAMPTIRHTLVALGAAVLATAAFAQAAPDAGASAPGHPQRGARLAERFRAADANNDGKLTRDEAKSKMPRVYQHFDEIDVNHTGAVTMADIAAYAQARRGAHKPAATP